MAMTKRGRPSGAVVGRRATRPGLVEPWGCQALLRAVRTISQCKTWLMTCARALKAAPRETNLVDLVRAQASVRTSRVLVVSPWGLADGYSGPLTLMSRLFSEMVKSGDIVIDVVFRETEGSKLSTPYFRHAFPLLPEASTFDPRTRLRWIVALTAFLVRRQENYDWIHFHGFYLTNSVPALIALRQRCPFTFLPVVEGGDLARIGKGRRGLVGAVFGRLLARRRQALGLALSPGIAAEMEALGLPRSRVLALPNIVDTRLFVPNEPSQNRQLRLGFIGKLGPTKNPIALVQAIRLLRDEGWDVIAVFVGPFADRAYEDIFRNAVTQAGIWESVVLAGYVECVQEYLGGIDVLVLPSSSEGLPGALVEAFACGVPVIGTDVGGMGDAIRRSGGGVVTTGSAEDIVQIIVGLSRSNLREMGASGRRYAVHRFSAESAALAYRAHVARHTEGKRGLPQPA